MEGQLTATVRWTEKLHLEGKAGFDHTIPLDFGPPLGDGNGIRPMELILIGLAGCSGQTVISLLQKMRQEVTGFDVRVTSRKKKGIPAGYDGIHIEYTVRGKGLARDKVEQAVRLSEEKYCTVGQALRKATEITHEITLVEE